MYTPKNRPRTLVTSTKNPLKNPRTDPKIRTALIIRSIVFTLLVSTNIASIFAPMSRDPILKDQWEQIQTKLSSQFSDGEPMDLDAILFLIGVQELGQIHRNYKKDQKLELLHIAICKVLEPYGYYKFDYVDEEGWPHYTVEKPLPPLKAGEQSVLMKESIVNYFLSSGFIE